MERCDFSDELSAYADGEMADQERVEIAHHLAECEACRKRLEVLEILHLKMRNSLNERVAAPELAALVVSQLPVKRNKPHVKWSWALAVVVCIAVPTVVAMLLLRPQQVEHHQVNAPLPAHRKEGSAPTASTFKENMPSPGTIVLMKHSETPAALQQPSAPTAVAIRSSGRSDRPQTMSPSDAVVEPSCGMTISIHVNIRQTSAVSNCEASRMFVGTFAADAVEIGEQTLREVISLPADDMVAEVVRPPLETVVKYPALQRMTPGNI